MILTDDMDKKQHSSDHAVGHCPAFRPIEFSDPNRRDRLYPGPEVFFSISFRQLYISRKMENFSLVYLQPLYTLSKKTSSDIFLSLSLFFSPQYPQQTRFDKMRQMCPGAITKLICVCGAVHRLQCRDEYYTVLKNSLHQWCLYYRSALDSQLSKRLSSHGQG